MRSEHRHGIDKGKNVKVHEGSGITDKYTGIERWANTEPLPDRVYGEGKYEQSPRRLQQR